MSDKDEKIDILLTQRFLPEFGGSIRWMYEVYRRWPTPVQVITHDYYNAPPRTPEFPDRPERPAAGDHVTDPNLKMDRRDIFIRDWGLENPKRALRYLRMTRAIGERLKSYRKATLRIHCVHAVPEVVSLLPLKMIHGNRMQIICYAHGEEVTACNSSRQLRWLMHRAYAACDLVIANSSYTKTVLRGHVDEHKVRVLNPGVLINEFDSAKKAGAAWRKENGLMDSLVVLTVGRLDPRKNHAAAIEAVAALKQRFPNIRYFIAGKGRNQPALMEQAQRLSVTDCVTFTGNVDGELKLALYGGCDLFAMPAIRDGTDVEGFGMVFLEAGACGKPSIAGREGGQAEAVVDGETGVVVDGTNQQAVTAALERLLSDAQLRQKLGQAGRKNAERYDWPIVVQKTVELVENI